MKKAIIPIFILVIIIAQTVTAQETYFGKNKVRYKDFHWSYIQTPRFDIYFYEDAYPTAKFTATVMESAYVEITDELNYKLQHRVPVFVYNSSNDFQQTNITQSLLPESVGGFTEAFKNRIVIPFNGSYEEFRHVLHHELTHAIIHDLVYGNVFSTLLSRQKFFNLPLWFSEGYAEYSSRHGWDYFSDMYIRDATINNYLTPPMYLGGFLAYKQGQAMIKYIVDTYGEDKIGEILKKGKVYLTLNKAMKDVIGKTEEELWEDFSKEMKRRYWPALAKRKEPDEFADQLTHSRKDGSYFNEKPTWHPDGDKLAIFTDKSDYTEIVLMDAKTGEILKRMVKGERTGDLESLHSYVSGMSFSPDGSKMIFVAKSNGEPTLMIYSLEKNKIIDKKRFDFYNILSPSWSPDGTKIAFAALKGHKRDIYIYELETEKLTQLTDDLYDDKDPSWFPNSQELVFCSDRPHPTSKMPAWQEDMYVEKGAYHPGGFEYGFYNLFRIDMTQNNKVTPLKLGPGQNTNPEVSPDGTKIAFISNRNGIDNIYIGYFDSTKVYPITDILTGVHSISWSPNGRKIAFSAFNKGGFDIFILKDLKPQGENNQLAKTDFFKGKYNMSKKARHHEEIVQKEESEDSTMTTEPSDSLAMASTEAGVDTTAVTDTATAVTDSTLAVTDTTTAVTDSTLAAADTTTAVTDTTIAVADTTTAVADTTGAVKDTLVTRKTGVTDEGFVYVTDNDSQGKFDSMFVDIPGSDSISNIKPVQEPAFFDSIPKPDKNGDYKIHKYKLKFTPDFMHATPEYNTFNGFQGQAYFIFTDYLGNNQFYIATDLVNTIDQSNVQFFYFYNRKRTNFGIGLFHTKNYYSQTSDVFFSDRFYGMQGIISYPFSTFSRIELVGSQFFIDREYNYIYTSTPRIFGDKRNSKITIGELSYVADNILWGLTGPVNGRRAKITVSSGINLFNSNGIQFSSVEFDYRKYYHIKNSFSFAFRATGGMSFGRTKKLYFLGGTTNWIGRRDYNAQVYDVENFYFADRITPLRGVPYIDLSGDRYGLVNMEFRFPMIDYFAMHFPLPLIISRVQGALFTDVGAAWYGSNFKGGVSGINNDHLQDIKVGFGFGMRMNLGFVLLRYDLAWATDLNYVSAHPTSYFSFGADF